MFYLQWTEWSETKRENEPKWDLHCMWWRSLRSLIITLPSKSLALYNCFDCVLFGMKRWQCANEMRTNATGEWRNGNCGVENLNWLSVSRFWNRFGLPFREILLCHFVTMTDNKKKRTQTAKMRIDFFSLYFLLYHWTHCQWTTQLRRN